ncbi:MAG TPA: DUF4271 domain-containing protein [Bacteroidales bacterium]|nr:DUF4271 domain-containing protein [Bacteroidales bacterium]HPS16026.1 DUF4271 domain-containing protein [Bacteroidales bacterium]
MTDSLSINPASQFNNSVCWFRNFIQMQDEVPAGVFGIKSDTAFEKQKIVQVKIEMPKRSGKSIFTSHQLIPSSFEVKKKEMTNPGWIAPLILFCFMLFAIAHYGWYKRMLQIFKAFFAGRLFVQLAREGGVYNERVTLLLFSSFIMGISIFLFQIANFYIGIPYSNWDSFVIFIQILLGVTLFYIIKMLLFRFSGYVFRSVKENSDYNLTIFVFGQIAGVAMLPIVLLVTYFRSEWVIIMGLIIFALLYIYRFYRGINAISSTSKVSSYYIFLYFCTLEILPFIIILKEITKF